MFPSDVGPGAAPEATGVDEPPPEVDEPSWLDDEPVPSWPEPVPVIDLTLAPGARLAAHIECAAVAPGLLARTDVLDTVEGVGVVQRWLCGVRIRMLAEFADRHPADTLSAPPGADQTGRIPSQRWVPDEIALTERISRLEALGEIAQAQRFTHVLPDTLALLEAGRIDLRRADAIARATAVLPDHLARQVETRVLANAPDATQRQLQDRVRRAIARVDPDGEHRRHREANRERRVSIRSLEDGMASLWFYGSAAEIETTWQMTDRLARSIGPDDPRTLNQRRFDLTMQVLQGRLTITDLSDVDTAVTQILTEQDTTDPDTTEQDAGRDGADTADPALAAADHEAASAGGDHESEPGRSSPSNGPGGGPDPAGRPGGPGGSDGPGASDGPDRPTDDPPHERRVSPDDLADAVAHALARRPNLHATIRTPLIHVVVGIDTLLGTDRPAQLVGHGPLDAATARTLAAEGVWQRLATDPLSGTLLDIGRTNYHPPAALNDHVRARDQVCRGPHCGRRIQELDHHQEWNQGGVTAESNLYGYCRHHHKLKDTPGWHIIAHPDRSLTWITPCGRRHRTEPFDHRPFTDELPNSAAPTTADTAGSSAPPATAGASADVPDDAPPPF